jgi:hypothetical protein
MSFFRPNGHLIWLDSSNPDRKSEVPMTKSCRQIQILASLGDEQELLNDGMSMDEPRKILEDALLATGH